MGALNMNIIRFNIAIALLSLLPLFSLAQAPANDSCSNKQLISISDNGLGIGTFQSDSVAMDSATIEVNEWFHNSLVTAGNDKKSIWYYFYIPSKRGISIELKQNANAISIKDCGFTTYFSDQCLPNSTMATAAKLTTLNQFGSSFHPCMEPGWYMVQVSAKTRALGKIYLEITTSYPYTNTGVTNAEYDAKDSAYNWGGELIGKDGWLSRYIDFELGCYSISDSSELLPIIGSNYEAYNQSAWFVFQSKNNSDNPFIKLRSPWACFGASDTVGFRLYEGDCRNGGTLSLMDSNYNHFANSEVCSGYCSDYTRSFPCTFDSGKYYSFQFLFHKDADEKVRLTVEDATSRHDSGHYQPTLTNSSNCGIIGSALKTSNFGFSCDSKLSDNSCGTVNPSNGIYANNRSYDYVHWKRFSVSEQSKLTLNIISDRTSPYNNHTSTDLVWFRLFKDTITSNCSDIQSSSIIYEGKGGTTYNINCLEPGNYSIQLLGIDSIINYSNWDCYGPRHLGRDYQLRLQATRLPSANRFSLYSKGDADSIYVINDTIKPLPSFSTLYLGRDTVSCNNAILPLERCDTFLTKAMYRVFTIGDGDNDNKSDSGLLYINGLLNPYTGAPLYQYRANHRLYKGNALTLRDQQSVSQYPDTLTGLTPYTNCFGPSVSTQSVCIEPGTYTLVSMFDDYGISRNERPSFIFRQSRPKFDTYAKAEFIDSVKYGTYRSTRDTFSCLTNTDTIDGVFCGKRNAYHVFYLDSTAVTTINVNYYNAYRYGPSRLSVFSGDIRNGKAGLKKYTNGTDWTCGYQFVSTDCSPMQPGWYTAVISNNRNISYDSNNRHNTTGYTVYTSPHQITINSRKSTSNPPKYSRPSKAANVDSLVNNNKALSYDTNYSSRTEMHQKMAKFNFPREVLECELDTPMIHFPKSQLCDTATTDIVYYTFSLEKKSYARIWGQVSGGTWDMKLYNFDVRKDSARLATATPVQNCNYNANYIEFCGLNKGTYSLVYFCKRTFRTVASVQPVMHLDSIYKSRFDHANNAYDFGRIPGTGSFIDGKVGTVHPIDTALPASHDIITCGTGAQLTDPTNSACYAYLNPFVYGHDSASMYPYDSAFVKYQNTSLSTYAYNIRRNLWYSFTVDGRGSVTIDLKTIQEKYLGTASVGLRFSLFESDEDGTLPLATLKSQGKIDSTLADGLSFKDKDYWSCRYGSDHRITFNLPACEKATPKRYYLLVEAANYQNRSTRPNINQHVWMQIKYDSLSIPDTKFDYYSTANNIDDYNDRNLVNNGFAQTGVSYWTKTKGNWHYTSGGYVGTYRLWGYNRYTYDTSRIEQTVDLSDYTSEINAGNATLNFWMMHISANETPPDSGRVILQYLNASGGVISSYTSNWLKDITWTKHSQTLTPPSGTVKVNIVLEAKKGKTTSNYQTDFYVDDVNLRISVKNKKTTVLKSNKRYDGDKTYFAGSTRDATDPGKTYYNSCTEGTVWYKFTVDSTGFMYYNVRSSNVSTNARTQYFDYSHVYMRLFRSTIPGDSINGLVYQPYISHSTKYNTLLGSTQAIVCVNPGTYYLNVSQCNWRSCNDYVIPQMVFDFHSGDFCDDAIPMVIDTLEKVTNQALVDCHTIGTDFGEDGSNMGCLFGPSGYKSSWFVVDYRDTTKVDLEFKLAEYTDAKASEIRYRTYYGNCKSLTPAPCNNNALTSFTLDCIRKGTYYVQVVTPDDAKGTLDMSVEAKENKDTTCDPVDVFQPNAAFYYNTSCPENVVEFVNTSSRGDSIRYHWDFGYGGHTDTSLNPVFVYPALATEQTYTVKLVVSMISRNSSDSITLSVTVPYSPFLSVANNDTSMCLGDSVVLTASLSEGIGRWSTGDTSSSIKVGKSGWYFYEMQNTPNLLVNANAEKPLSTGWTVVSGNWTRRSSSPYPEDSSYSFYANNSAGISELNQTIDVTYDSANIDAGRAKTSLISFVQSASEATPDETEVRLEYLDSNNNLIAVYNSGYKANVGSWLKQVHSRTTPKFTRKLKVILRSNNLGSNAYSQGFIDNVVLRMRSACDYIDSVYVKINPIPVLEMGNDTTLCYNNPITLTADSVYYNNPYWAYETFSKNGGSGTLKSNAQVKPFQSFLTLTENSTYKTGTVEWEDSTLTLSDTFEIGFEFKSGYSTGCRGESVYAFLFNSQTPTAENHYASGGYKISFGERYPNRIYIYWANSLRRNIVTNINFDKEEWHKVVIRYENKKFSISIDDVTYASWTDPTARTQVGNLFGLGGRNSSCYNLHLARNYYVTKNNPELVVIPTAAERRINMKWADGNTDSLRTFTTSQWVKASITDQNGCESNEDSLYLTTIKLYDSLLGLSPNVCSELDTFRINPLVSGGLFSGNNALDSSGLVTVDSGQYGSNFYRYEVQDTFGCMYQDSGYFTIDSIPNITFSLPPVKCKNSDPFNITVNHTDGFFYGGSYVDSSGLFTPNTAGQDSSWVYYRTNGNYCVALDSIQVVLDSIPSSKINPAGPFCMNQGQQIITPIAGLVGKFVSTTYLDTIGKFSPAVAGAGSFNVVYEVTDGNGCYSKDSATILVDSLPSISLSPAKFCKNSGIQHLTVNTSGSGKFQSTLYLDSIGQFDPSISDTGQFLVFYNASSIAGCTNRDSVWVEVDSIPNVRINPAGPFCLDAGQQTITVQQGIGGKFTISSYIDSLGRFEPNVATAGNHLVSYAYIDGNGCANRDTIYVQVDTLPDASITSAGPFCMDVDSIQLTLNSSNNGAFIASSFVSATGMFYPSLANTGSHQVVYEATNSFNCTSRDSITIVVDSLPDASITAAGPFCENAGIQTLTPQNNSGGLFTNSAFIDSTGAFDPRIAKTGAHQVFYTFTDGNGCSNMDSTTVLVDSIPDASINPTGPFCANASTQQITPRYNTGGAFTLQSYVTTGGVFDPSIANRGSHRVHYTFTDGNGCTATDSIIVVVDSIPDASILSAGPFCENADTQTIVASNPIGRFISQTFVSDSGRFVPAVAKAGNHWVYYEVTDGNGCYYKDSLSVSVDTIPDASITAAGPFCENAGIQTLTPQNNTGGLFTNTTFLDSTGAFDPSIAKTGAHQIFYTFTDGNGCSNKDSSVVIVDSIPDASINPTGPFCANASTQQITPRYNIGGAFTLQPYVTTGGVFDPSIANRGSHRVQYTFTDGNGCTATDSITVAVDSIPDASIVSAGPFCENADTQTIVASNPIGRFLTQTFVSDSGRFVPAVAKAGNHWVYYEVTDGNTCYNKDSLSVSVDTIPDASITAAGPFCENAGIQTLTPQNNYGGLFTNSAFIDSTGAFDPSIAKTGAHQVFYTFTDGNGCSNMDSTTVLVDSIPDASLVPSLAKCENSDSFYVLPRFNFGGRFTSTSYVDTAGLFWPSISKRGSHLVQYTFTDSKGCTSLDSTYVSVDSLPDAGIIQAGPFCLNEGIQNILPALSGGKFSGGLYIDTIGKFDPLIAGIGNHLIYHEINDGQGCWNIDSQWVRIDTIPDASITPDGPFCESASMQTITALYNPGGFFTKTAFIDSTGEFDPRIARQGSHQVYYTFIDANGCSGTDSMVIPVDSTPDASLLPSGPYCANVSTQQITPRYNSGGNFTVQSYVTSAGVFDPTIANSGKHKVHYTFIDGNGCTAMDSITVVVDSVPIASILNAGPFCENADTQTLVASNPIGQFVTQSFVSSSGQFVPPIAQSGSHWVYYEVTDGNSCYNKDSILILVDTIPNATIRSAGPFCEDDLAIMLEGAYNTGGNFEVTPFLTALGEFYPSLAAIGSQWVYYSFTDDNLCFNRDSLSIVVDTLPNAAINSAGPFCLNAGIQQLVATFVGGGTFSGLGVQGDGILDPVIMGVGKHWVYYTVVNDFGCSGIDSIEVEIWPLPDASFPEPLPICLNDAPIQITPTHIGGSFSGGSYISTSGLFDPAGLSAGKSKVFYQLSDINGCISSDSQQVTVLQIPLNTMTITPLEGCEPLDVAFSTEPGYSILWELNAKTWSTESGTESLLEGIYPMSLTVSNVEGCTVAFDENITVYKNPIAAFSYTPEKAYINNPRFDFLDESLENISFWDWAFGDGNTGSGSNPSHSYNSPGSYPVLLEVTDINGCVDTVTHTVNVLDELLYFIPNAFSPNADGDNDVFRVYGLGIENITCSIYNRWGEKLLHQEDFKQWDGQYKDEPAQTGVYVYVMTIRDNKGSKYYVNGEIHLVR